MLQCAAVSSSASSMSSRLSSNVYAGSYGGFGNHSSVASALIPSRILPGPRNREQERALSHSLNVVWDCRIKREKSGKRQFDLILVGNVYSNASVDRLNRDSCICMMLGQPRLGLHKN